MTARILLWWRTLPRWARWATGVGVGLAVLVAFVLRRGRPSVRQVLAGADAAAAAREAEAAADEARVAARIVELQDELELAAVQRERDEADDAEAEAVTGEVVGDGLRDLGDGVRGGRLEDL